MRWAAALLCALGLSSCGTENLDACQAWEAYFAGLPCAAGLDDGVDCQALAGYPCPAKLYFQCLQDKTTCNGDVLQSDLTECELRCDP